MKQEPAPSFLSVVLTVFFIAGSAIFFLVGCASTAERTESMLAGGRVDDALSFIENARRNDPKDAEYLSLERKVRLQWISDKLIEVRLTRLSDSKGASNELMRKVLKNESDWSLIPTGAVYATQAEETAHLSDFVQSSIYESIAQKQPLAALAKFRRDRALLEEVLKVKTDRLKSSLISSGRGFCDAELKLLTPKDYYQSLFLRDACRELQHTIVLPKTTNSVRLFGELKPEVALTKVPPERVSDFTKDLKTEFEKSIWHDPEAKKTLPLKLSGSLEEKISERAVYRSKEYTVRVPYEETSVRKKSQKTGLETAFEILAWALTTYVPSRERDNGDGTVTVTETKYRDSTRLFPYQATEVTQNLSVAFKIELAPQGAPHEFEFKEHTRMESDEHGVSFPDAGLSPQARKLATPTQWLLSLNRKLMDRISDEFNVAWIDRFCSDTSAPLKADELQHRCIYGANGHAPSNNRDWFRKRYGIEIETWRQLVAVRK